MRSTLWTMEVGSRYKEVQREGAVYGKWRWECKAGTEPSDSAQATNVTS